MKNKLLEDKETEFEQKEEHEEDIDISSEGPSISSSKKSKMTIVAASSLLITIVLYFFFFKDTQKSSEKLEEVNTPKTAVVAPNAGGRSPFEFDQIPIEREQNADLLEKPPVPEIPSLPSLPESNKGLLSIIVDDKKEPIPVTGIAPEPAKPAEEKKAEIITDPTQAATQDSKQSDPRYAPIIVLSGDAGPTRSVGYDKNIVKLKEDPISQLAQTQSQIVPTYVKDRTHTIVQGKLLTAVLETAINTEVPGTVRGIVSRDVYGESGQQVLIPRGSRLYGSYTSQVTRGQGRVEITWTRLIRPDGVDLNISFNAADQFGRSGIAGEVDNRYGSVITNSILTSILAVGGVAAAEKLIGGNSASTTTTGADGSVSTTGRASSQAIYDVSKTIIDTVGQITGAALNLGPVIRIPQGTRITVIVNSDMTVPPVRKAYSTQ